MADDGPLRKCLLTFADKNDIFGPTMSPSVSPHWVEENWDFTANESKSRSNIQTMTACRAAADNVKNTTIRDNYSIANDAICLQRALDCFINNPIHILTAYFFNAANHFQGNKQ